MENGQYGDVRMLIVRGVFDFGNFVSWPETCFWPQRLFFFATVQQLRAMCSALQRLSGTLLAKLLRVGTDCISTCYSVTAAFF